MHLADNLIVLISPALTKRQNVDIEKSASLQTVFGRNTSVLFDINCPGFARIELALSCLCSCHIMLCCVMQYIFKTLTLIIIHI